MNNSARSHLDHRWIRRFGVLAKKRQQGLLILRQVLHVLAPLLLEALRLLATLLLLVEVGETANGRKLD